MSRCIVLSLALCALASAQLRHAIDIDRSERVEVSLGGKAATVELIATSEDRDPASGVIREARAQVKVNGRPLTLTCGNYNLPVQFAGVQIDCPVTGAYLANSTADHWGLTKAARLRLWPAGSPWIEPGSLIYPVKQKWFATSTQMSNEPTYVDGGERASRKRVYYHSGLDIGGAEGLIDVVAATDGLVVSSGTAVMPEHARGTPAAPRYDVVYLLDSRGWYYRYSHFASIEPGVTPGSRVKQGQKIGVLGKEGGSGGWSHLHFEAVAKQPSGKWGTEDGYAYLWQAWLAQSKADLIAVARPHRVVYAGGTAILDGSRSWSREGAIVKYEWILTDGTRATGARVQRRYGKPGYYSEILRITGPHGRVAHDFAIVEVAHRPAPEAPELMPPTIHAAFSPTAGIRLGQPIDLLVRSFRTTHGSEVWDFGDGTPTVTVQSDGCVKPLAKDGYARTVHRYAKPGRYLASVRRTNERGEVAVARLEVLVEE